MNGPQSSESCHFRGKTGGLSVVQQRDKNTVRQMYSGGWGGRNFIKPLLKLFLGHYCNRNVIRTGINQVWSCWVIATKIFVIVRTALWGNRDVFFFLRLIITYDEYPPLLKENWGKVTVDPLGRCHPLQRRLQFKIKKIKIKTRALTKIILK